MSLDTFVKATIVRLAPTAVILCASLANVHAQQDRVTARIDNRRTVELTRHMHSKAQTQYDQGVVEDTFSLPSITLHFKLSADQQQNLSRLLSDQQNPSSPQFHKWLTPEQYADQFGASSSDMAKIMAWLQSQGFNVVSTARSRTWIAASGTARQVRNGLHADIH